MEPNLPDAVIKQLYCQKKPNKWFRTFEYYPGAHITHKRANDGGIRLKLESVKLQKSSLPWEPQMTTSQHSACVLCGSPPLEPCTLWFRRKNTLFCRGQWPLYSSQSLEWREGERGGNREGQLKAGFDRPTCYLNVSIFIQKNTVRGKKTAFNLMKNLFVGWVVPVWVVLLRFEVPIDDAQTVEMVQSQCQLCQVELHILLCEHDLQHGTRQVHPD